MKGQPSLQYSLLTVMQTSGLIWKHAYPNTSCKNASTTVWRPLKYIREEYPDIVICDMMLHGMYGNELSSRLKTSGETSIIPIILYGSYLDGKQQNTREASLADVFLHTPFHVEDLKNRNKRSNQK